MRTWPHLARRDVLKGLGAAALAPLLPARGFANLATGVPLHGLSAFGELKYPADFKQFDYATPDAPKGGTFNFAPPNWQLNQSVLTFNTLNSFVLRGQAPARMELCFDQLMTSALDEPDALYGLAAQSVTVSPDRNVFDFAMRPDARFHDGSALTAADVAFTYTLLKEKGHPNFQQAMARMKAAEADGNLFRLVFDGQQAPRLYLTLAALPILSRADIEANGFEGSAMRPLLGSGPYKVGAVSPGQSIEYDRVADYWGVDLPVNRGFYHFDRIRIEFYGDRQAAFEAFKKGEIRYRQEFTSRVWATEYNFPAIAEKKVVKREFPSELRPILQAWAINQRRERFKDVRVRQAIGLCFDFEWTNRNLFYDLYARTQSIFERSDFAATGMPSPEELALLEPLRGKIPDAAFGEAVEQPVSNGSGRDRKLLSAAAKLLAEVGYTREGNFLAKDGERLTLEMLAEDETFIRLVTPYVENMRAIGIDASIRMVDSTQYEARQNDFDFDMIMHAVSFGATPGRETLETYFHSSSATRPGTSNLTGTADAAVDELVEIAGRADSRAALTVALRALDRVMRARHDWIPNWYAPNHRAAYWDMFGFREPKPDYGFPVEALWWIDKDKAARIGAR